LRCAHCLELRARAGIVTGALHAPAAPSPAKALRVEARDQLRDRVKDSVDRAAVRSGLRCSPASASPPQPVLAAGGVH
jgi:hypothetical protein